MFIILGSRLYGKTEEVPGHFHVATEFFHIYYVPLIPTGSRVVEMTDRGPGRIFKHPFSFKSVGMAYLNATLVGAAIILTGGGVIGLAVAWPWTAGPAIRAAGMLALGILAMGALWWLGRSRLTRANYESAIRIAERAGYTPQGLIEIDVAFGKLSREEAEALMRDGEPKGEEDIEKEV